MYFSRSPFHPALLALLGGNTLASAVCSGFQVAIGTGSANTTSGKTTYDIYTAPTCAVSQTVSVDTLYPCDSPYFYCKARSTSFQEYDDPSTGISYLCTPVTGETCAGDAVTYCCTYGFVPQ